MSHGERPSDSLQATFSKVQDRIMFSPVEFVKKYVIIRSKVGNCMIFGMTFYQICIFFLLYSFIGWVVEVTFHAVALGLVINRGFLNGPVCPVYGFGMLAVLAMVHTASGYFSGETPLWLLFLGGMLLTSSIELLAGWALDVLFHAKWWDYSDKPFNFHGYICLEFSLFWGLGVVLVMRVFHPMLDAATAERIPPSVGWPLLGVFYALYIADAVVTVLMIVGFNRKLKELDELKAKMRVPSDAITKVVATNAIRTSAAIGESRVQASLAKAEFQSAASEKYEEALIAMSEGKAAAVQAMSEGKAAAVMAASELKETMTEKAGSLKGAVTGKAGDLKETVTGKAGDLKETVTGKAGDLKGAVTGKAGDLKNAVTGKAGDLRGAVTGKAGDLKGAMTGKAAELQRKTEELIKQVADSRYFGIGRMMRAFPQLQHRDYKEMFSELKSHASLPKIRKKKSAEDQETDRKMED